MPTQNPTAAAAQPQAIPAHADSFMAEQLRIGMQRVAQGRIMEAVAAYQSGLAAIADRSPESSDRKAVNDKLTAELHFKLGNAAVILGELSHAAANYKAALQHCPDMTAGWCNLGIVYQTQDRPQDAITLYARALALDPGHWATRTNLAQALMTTRQYAIARALLLELLAERPQDPQLHSQLGKLYGALDDDEQALGCFERAVALNPADAESFYWIGSLHEKLGSRDAAEAVLTTAAQLQPLIPRPAKAPPAEFRVLSLFSPFAGNTPTEYLLAGKTYDVNTLTVFVGRRYDVDLFRRSADLVVNLICDADQGQSLLPLAADIADLIGLPVLNDPRKVARTSREQIALLLRGLPGCVVPQVARLAGGPDGWVAMLKAAATFSTPVLARPAGTHGGDNFEKFDSMDDALEFCRRQHGMLDHYLIEYADYRSTDGYFRRYRFIFVGEDILPHHLAIGRDWKLHHDSTDMADHTWMQEEEEAFLKNPAAVFSAANYRTLDAVRKAIDLDYAGIDCGLDREGNVVVFEVNAAMLVHQHNDAFPYKAPYVERINTAFDSMLRRLITRPKPSAPAGVSYRQD